MSDQKNSRADMHVHSAASARSKLGVQRSLSLPECATEPAEVYELAKQAGMDFVTITDHDTIDGALQIDHLPDTFISVELTAHFKGEPQAVHVLCYGITPEQFERLQAHCDDVTTCAAYLAEHEITCALAHPFYAVRAPLKAHHRQRLAQLFSIWETRNGARARELNLPALVYVATHGRTGIGGSDDHAGVDVGRTFTQTPAAATPAEFLAHVRAGRAQAHGAQGSAAKWAHAAIVLAIRALGPKRGERPDPEAVLRIAERVIREGELRHGRSSRDLGAQDARALAHAWLAAVDPRLEPWQLVAALQRGELSHPDLQRRAIRSHERALAKVALRPSAAGHAAAAADTGIGAPASTKLASIGSELFEACVPAIPYAASTALLGREKRKLSRAEGEPRVALVAGLCRAAQRPGARRGAGGARARPLLCRLPGGALPHHRKRRAPRCARGAAGEDRRWDRGVDLERFGAHLRRPGALPGALNVLYAGRLSREKGVELLADAFLAARARDPRLHLVLAGGGPEERALRERLGSYATFLGWLGDAELARAYASAEVFIFASRTDTFGQVVLEEQASGLPVLAVGEGGPASLIEDGRTGLLRAATVEALSAGLAELAGAPALRQRLARGGLAAVRRRSWKAALDRLAGGYRVALAQAGRRPRRRAA